MSAGLVRSDCRTLGYKSQAGEIRCLPAFLSTFATSQLVERCLPAGRACSWWGLLAGLLCPFWLLLAVSCVELLHLCLECMTFTVICDPERIIFLRFLFCIVFCCLFVCFWLTGLNCALLSPVGAYSGYFNAKWGIFFYYKKDFT